MAKTLKQDNTWAYAWKYGSMTRTKRKGRRYRRAINRMKNFQREQEAQRQHDDQGLDWNEVKRWLDDGFSLEEAKIYARTEI